MNATNAMDTAHTVNAISRRDVVNWLDAHGYNALARLLAKQATLVLLAESWFPGLAWTRRNDDLCEAPLAGGRLSLSRCGPVRIKLTVAGIHLDVEPLSADVAPEHARAALLNRLAVYLARPCTARVAFRHRAVRDVRSALPPLPVRSSPPNTEAP